MTCHSALPHLPTNHWERGKNILSYSESFKSIYFLIIYLFIYFSHIPHYIGFVAITYLNNLGNQLHLFTNNESNQSIFNSSHIVIG